MIDPFAEYRKKYPQLDIDQQYRDAKTKLGFSPGRKFFEGWLKVASRDSLEIPEWLQDNYKEPAEPKMPKTWEP